MWPFSLFNVGPFEMWPIFRKTGSRKIYGRSISVFVNNIQSHLTTVDVYADGAIDCWGFVDLELFALKLSNNWVAAPIKDQSISVFNFGYAAQIRGYWSKSNKELMAAVTTIIKELNPKLSELLDMQGSNTEIINGVKCAKMGMSNAKSFYLNEITGSEVIGDTFPIVKVAKNKCILTKLFVFSDEMVRIGISGDLMHYNKLFDLFANGSITNSVPEGNMIAIPGLGKFKAEAEFGYIPVNDRMAEVRDKINELNGKPGLIIQCRDAYKDYRSEPCDANRKKLSDCYEAVPKHLRRYCGDMDSKDHGIKAAIADKEKG